MHRALNNALEACGWLGVRHALFDDQPAQLLVDESLEAVVKFIDIDPARAQHGDGVLVLAQREQQMLERRIFMMTSVGQGQGAMKTFFQGLR